MVFRRTAQQKITTACLCPNFFLLFGVLKQNPWDQLLWQFSVPNPPRQAVGPGCRFMLDAVYEAHMNVVGMHMRLVTPPWMLSHGFDKLNRKIVHSMDQPGVLKMFQR